MKKARRNGFIKITAILLACIVSVGMLPMSYGTSSADAADSDDYVSGSDLKATLYTYDGDTPVYYHSDWTQGEIYVEVEGETDKEVTGAFYKKNGDSDWTSANVNVTPIEAEPSTEPQPTEEPTETATVSSSESGRTADEESAVQEEVGEPEDQEPAPAEITGYKVASDFWVTEPNGTYEGTYDFKCEYSDGTDTAYTNFFTVRIDNYFDKLEASLDKGGDGWSHKAVFSGSVSDKGSGIDKVWYSYGDNEVEIAPDDKGDWLTKYCYSEEDRQKAISDLSPEPEITRFKGLGEISPDEFRDFIGPDIRLEQVTLRKTDQVKELLEYYMGKNTMERQNFIIDNLVIEEDRPEDEEAE